MENRISVIRKSVDFPGGNHAIMFSLLSDRYHIWIDVQGFHRWALSSWADNGLGGVVTHGKSMTLEGAAAACYKNDNLRKEIYGE